MKTLSFVLAILLVFLSSTKSSAQLTGIKTIPGDYPTIRSAVNALNTQGVGPGGVIFNIPSNYLETITGTIALTATGTASNTIIFQKDPATGGDNPKITAYVGTATPASALQDGIWRLEGSDYVTIDGIDLFDPNTTNPATMEYGYALYKGSATNGSQNVTIKNCIITLNKINNAAGTGTAMDGSVGIVVTNAIATAATSALTPTTAAGSNSNNKFYSNAIISCNTGIALNGYAAPGPFTLGDTGNDVGGGSISTGNTITNFGGGGIASAATGIKVVNQWSTNVSFNNIDNNDGTSVNHATGLQGISLSGATSGNATVTYNIITIKGGGTTTDLIGIDNSSGSTAASNSIVISGNTIQNSSYSTATTGSFYGIRNSASPANLEIKNNIFNLNSTAATSGNYFLVNNTGNAGSIIIDYNDISNISFSASTSLLFKAINNTGATAGGLISISNNNIGSISYSGIGTGIFYGISNTGASLLQNISSNTFSGLSLNTSGNVFLLLCDNSMPANGIRTINGNSIAGTLSKNVSGGTLYFYYSASASSNSSSETNNNNNFSNITVGGATIIGGWYSMDGAAISPFGPAKTIAANTFNNITGGAGAISALVVANSNNSTSNNISGNSINVLSSTGSITGIASAGGSQTFITNTITGLSSSAAVTGINISGGNAQSVAQNIINNLSSSGASAAVTGILISGGTTVGTFSNTINTLSSSGSTAMVSAINVTGGTTHSIYRNKIYDILETGTGGMVNGLNIGAGTNVTVHNNLIGDLRTPAATNTIDVIRGISILSTTASSSINVYYNTIYLNATSTGANFSTSGIYHTANTTATTATLLLRNNIINNSSAANGSGLAVAFRRSAATLNNYGATSNNNIYYAGPPSATHVLYYDGTSSDQTLSTFKTRMATRDAGSFTEASAFLNTVGFSSNFLHLDPSVATQAESGGVNVTGTTADIDGEVRQGNAGYAGAGSAPDIGADEGNFIVLDLNPPVIVSVSPIAATCNLGDQTLTVSITDNIGIPTSGPYVPKIYFKKNSGSYIQGAGSLSSGTNTNGTWTFLISSANVGGISAGDVISYFIVVQDLASNVASNPGDVIASDVNTVNVLPSLPLSYPIKYTINGTYTVGASQAAPFNSLTNAINNYNNSCATGPVTLVLSDGSYSTSETFPITINANAGASAINTLTIKPAPSVSPVISGSSTSTIVDLNGAAYVTINGSNSGGTTKDLTISNTNTNGAAIRFVNDASNNTIKNSIIKGVSTVLTTATVFISNTTGTNGNDNNTVQNNDITKGTTSPAFAILNLGATGSSAIKNSGNIIAGNRIFDFTNTGIEDEGGSVGTLYSSNDLFQLTTQSTNLVGFSPNGNTIEGFTFSGNRIYDLKTTSTGSVTGINLINITSGGTGRIQNNFIAIRETAPLLVRGIYDQTSSAQNWEIYFNTISISGTVSGLSNSETYFRDISSSSIFKNNLLSNTRSGGTGKHYAIRTTTSINGFTSDFNNIYAGGGTGNVFGNDGSDRVDLAAWKASTLKDPNSITNQPIFVSATDLHLATNTGCTLDGRGTPIAGINSDIDNESRHATNPDIGADEFTAITAGVLAGTTGGAQVCRTLSIGSVASVFTDASCNLIATVTPSGTNPLAGSLNSCVKIDATVQSYNAQAYVQRHYDITPSLNPATSTGVITLYFTQAEFNSFNVSRGSLPTLPTGSADAVGKSNLRVIQYHGTGTAPGNYSGTTVTIDPVDNNIVWNAAANRWEVTFPVNGFSGFYISSSAVALPVTFISFSGERKDNANHLTWTTAAELNNKGFTIEKSTDGREFNSIGFVAGRNNAGNESYTFTDANINSSKQFYRIRQQDNNGNSKLTNTIVIQPTRITGFHISGFYPNPATTYLNVLLEAPSKDIVRLQVMDASGRLIKSETLVVQTGFNSHNLDINEFAAGTYFIKLISSNRLNSDVKVFVKE